MTGSNEKNPATKTQRNYLKATTSLPHRDSYLYTYSNPYQTRKTLTNLTIHKSKHTHLYTKNIKSNQPTEFLGCFVFQNLQTFPLIFCWEKVISAVLTVLTVLAFRRRFNRGKVPVSYPTPVNASTAGEVPNGGGETSKLAQRRWALA